MTKLLRGDVIFVRGKDWESVAIEDITHSAYSHVALAVSDGLLIEAVAGSPVRFAHALEYHGLADVYRTTLTASQIETVMCRAQAKLGESYDYLMLVSEFIREETHIQVPYEERHKVICSTLVAHAFRPEWDPCPGIEYPAPGDLSQSSLWRYQFSY